MQNAAVVADFPLAVAQAVSTVSGTHLARVAFGARRFVRQHVLIVAAGSVVAHEVPSRVAPLENVRAPGGFATDARCVGPHHLRVMSALLIVALGFCLCR